MLQRKIIDVEKLSYRMKKSGGFHPSWIEGTFPPSETDLIIEPVDKRINSTPAVPIQHALECRILAARIRALPSPPSTKNRDVICQYKTSVWLEEQSQILDSVNRLPAINLWLDQEAGRLRKLKASKFIAFLRTLKIDLQAFIFSVRY